ncbi:hypothetical protein L1987_15338 [Smallanthus sonchifolius]|uniref:Uncharacterized protein n=1 Tax=Smallanthus sonchifolius TaxID=185202 RepID=A0ACB9J7W3_9ASTR|nr:hypothetical protein L1987_15338 [Smallanthus sonchifolius]
MKERTIQQLSLDTHKERPKVSKNDDFVVSSDIASHSVLYPANLSNDKVNNILDKQGVILQDDDSSDEPKIEKVDAIHIHTTEKLPSPWNRDKVAERLKNKRVEETTKATSSRNHSKLVSNVVKKGTWPNITSKLTRPIQKGMVQMVKATRIASLDQSLQGTTL